MLDPVTLKQLANQLHCSTYVVLREYCQAVILEHLADSSQAHAFVFKGGTCIRFLFQGDRFSEDLDFTVKHLDPTSAAAVLTQATDTINEGGTITLVPKKTLAGQRLMLTWSTPVLKTAIKIKLDLSFREQDLPTVTSPLTFTRYPIKSGRMIYHYPREVILAEKIHALMTRVKGRDLYDLWFLLSMLTPINLHLVNQKLAFFRLTFDRQEFLDRLAAFPAEKFVTDLTPFVTDDLRPTLADIHRNILATLPTRLAKA